MFSLYISLYLFIPVYTFISVYDPEVLSVFTCLQNDKCMLQEVSYDDHVISVVVLSTLLRHVEEYEYQISHMSRVDSAT